jgi:uncharacterized membrane protein (DUF2068 family)
VAPEPDTRPGAIGLPDHRRKNPTTIRLIAAFKLLKGLLLLALAIGALKMLNESVGDQVSHWLAELRVDPDNHYIHGALVKLARLDNRKLEEISAGSFFYAAILLTEGVGLFLGKRWAEYFTIIATGSFIPLEVYELAKKVSVGKVIALVINVAVVFYLIVRVRQKTKQEDVEGQD